MKDDQVRFTGGEASMVSLLRRSLKNDSTRSGLYLIIGVFLFGGALNAFWVAGAEAQRRSSPQPTAQAVAPPPTAPVAERYVEPAAVEFPFF